MVPVQNNQSKIDWSIEGEKIKDLVIDKMENAMKLNVPIVVDYGIGNSWYDAH